MWRRSFIVAAIVFGVIAGIIVGLQSPRVAHNLKAHIKAAARSNFGLRVEIKELSIELLPPAIHFAGIEVYRPDREIAWMRLHHGQLRVQPWPSAAGVVVIDHLELDGFEIEYTLDPESQLEGGFEGVLNNTRLPVDIRELFIWNARIKIDTGDGGQGIACQGIDLTLRPHEEGGRQITLDIPSGTLEIGGRSLGFEARADARLEGTLDRPQTLSVQRAQIFLRQIALRAAGRLALGTESAEEADAAKMQFTIEGGVSLAHLQQLFDDLPDLRGDARVKAEIRSTSDSIMAPLVRLEAEIKNARLEGQSFGNVGLNLLYEGSDLNIEAFKIDQTTNSVTGSGHIDLDSKELSVVARIHRASLPVILHKAGLPDSWVRLDASGDVQGTGSLIPFRLDIAVDLEVEHFAALDRSYRDPEAIEILAVDGVSISGRAVIGTRAIEVSGVLVKRGNTTLVANGVLSYDPDVGIDMRVSGETLDMADVGHIAGIDFSGTGTVFATIEGPYTELTISGTPEIKGFGVFGRVIGDTKATVIFEKLRLSVARAAVRRGRGTIKGEGWVDFDADEPQVRADFVIKNVDLAGLLAAVELESHRLRITANVDGRIDLTGALARPRGVVDLKADQVLLANVPLGPMTFAAQLARKKDELLTIVVHGEPAGGELRAVIGIRAPRALTMPAELDIDLSARNISLETIGPLIGVPLAGTLTARAELSGPVNGLTGTIAIEAPTLDVWGVNVGSTQVRGEARGGKVFVTGTSLHGKARLSGNLIIGRRLPYSVEVIFTDADLHESFDLPRNLTIRTSGTVFSQGDLTRPASVSADIQLSKAELILDDFEFHLVRDARFTYGNGRLDIVDLGLQGTGLTANIGGRIIREKGLEIEVAAKGDLGIAVLLIPSLAQARGPFDARLSIAGSIDAPVVHGSAQLHGARLRLKTLRQDFDDVRARIDFAGRDIEIREGSAKSGGGTVTFGGGMLLPAAPDERTQLRLYSEFQDVTIKPVRGMVLIGSGRLNLTGPLGDLLLKGRVDVDELRYTKSLELTIDSLFPRRDAPLRAPNFAPGQTVAVDVHLEAPANVYLNAGTIDAEFRASLDFRGTTESLGLLGNLTPLTATARYRDLVFELVRGDIVFTEEFRLFAKYDFTAEAEGCGMDMTLNLVGDSRGKYTIEVTGEDENGPVHEQDPWSCISFGVRLSKHSGRTRYEDYSESGAARTGIGDTAGAVGDILWGMSGLDAKVRRLLPFVDEARISLGRSGRRGNRRLAPRLVVRKGIANRLQLKYDGAIDEADDQVFSLEYALSDNATLEGSWVSISDVPIGDFGLDLRLHWEFD